MNASISTIEDIYAAINPLPGMLAEKGKKQPEAVMRVEANAGFSIHLSWVEGRGIYEREYRCFLGSAEEVVAKAIHFINELPSAEYAKLYDFMGALGKVIDAGRDLGVDVDYLNPLTDTMKRLSQNIITFRGSAAA